MLMKEITYFYIEGCPFCRKADKYIEELIAENPEFAAIKITKIEEHQNASLAKTYNYFFVPSLWIGKEKLHEGAATKEKIKNCLNAAL